MNDARRKELRRAWDLLEEARTIIETAKDEESEYVDAIPESMEAKREAAQEKADKLSEIEDAIADQISELEEAVS